MVPTILKPNHWKSKQKTVILFQLPMVFNKMTTIFVQNRTPLENRKPLDNQTEGYHWKFEHVGYSSPPRSNDQEQL